MDFSYTASDKQGVKQKGKLEASDQKEVIEYLRLKGLIPIKVRRIEFNSFSIFSYLSRITENDLVVFTRQLSSMITTGLTVIECLNILKHQNNKPQMQKVIDELISNLSEGNSLSKAMKHYPHVFSTTYIALIRSAEEGGALDTVLSRLANNLEKSEEVKKKVKSALLYPAIIIVSIVVVLIIMNLFVIPQLSILYSSLDLKLPLTTRIVLAGSEITRALLPYSIFFIIGGAIGYNKFRITALGVKSIDKLRLNFPVLGNLVTLSILSEINRTISILVGSGASLINAIQIASDVAGNFYYKNALMNTGAMVEKGSGLSIGLQNQNIFPPLMIQMVRVGETTGKLDESLLKVSEYIERDLDLKVRTLTTAIEPILIIFLGISVALLIISVITPIYSLISQIQ